VHLEQLIANRAAQFSHTAARLQFHLLEENSSSQRITVCVQPARGYADDRVAWLDGFAVEHPGPFHHADNRAADIVFARLIEAGHLSGFAADERTIVFRAGLREAFDDFWPIFESYKGIRGVLHSFTDTQANLERALSHGLYIGVNGIVTFTKSQVQIDMYRSVPLQNLLLETDAPFLTPTPYRGTICEPKHVLLTAKFVSTLRHESLQELAAATTANARRLFIR